MKIIENSRLAVFAGSMLLTFGLATTDLVVTGCGGASGGASGSASVDPETPPTSAGPMSYATRIASPSTGSWSFPWNRRERTLR
jgi:hypothetical protein